MSDDWTKLFGSIDVGVSSSPQPARANAAPVKLPTSVTNTPAPNTPATVPPPAQQQVAPGVFQMAASFGTAIAKFAAGGFRTTGTELHQKRLAVCDDCQYRAGTTCILCGCILPLKAKMPHETCPIGKWEW